VTDTGTQTERTARYARAREALQTALREDENPGFAGARSQETDERLVDLQTRRWRAYNDLLDAKHDIIKHMDNIERDFTRARPYFNGESGYFNEHGLLQTTGQRLEALCARFPLLVDRVLDAEYDYLEATEV
jgi:hypothetical protein